MSDENCDESKQHENTNGSSNEEDNVARLNKLRERGWALLTDGDSAIRAALSADSEKFLRQNRQCISQ